MKPALSIVCFTVLSGAGLGLAVFIAAAGDLPSGRHVAAVLTSLLLVGGGLGASVFHLANPKNAWRAFMRVRTSWLSREAVLAAVFFPLMLLYAFAADWGALRAAVALVALLTVYCTAMIYQSLKPIQQWHHPLTAVNYLLLALLSGSVLFHFFTEQLMPWATVALTVAAAGGKYCHYRRIGACRDIRISHATGFSRAQAKLLDAGHTGPTFLTREFIYQQPAAVLLQRRRLALGLSFAAPLAALAVFAASLPLLAALAAAAMFGGLLLERWLFFAEAHHSVRAYHGVE